MTDREILQAAIDELEARTHAASPGPWTAWRKAVRLGDRCDPRGGPLNVALGIENARGDDITGRLSLHDATLIHTLHATIDAQIALLKLAIDYGDLQVGRGSQFIARAHELAKAILGELVTP